MLWLLAALLLAGPKPETLQAQARLKDGQKLMASERFEQAAEAFRDAIRLDPLLTMAHYGLGQAHMALKQYPSAVIAFRGARESFHNRVAESVTRSMENDVAREDRIRSLRDRIRENQERPINPSSAEGRLQQQRIQQWEVEISMLQRPRGLGAKTPDVPPGISLALGSAYFRSGQLQDAEREYRAALDADGKLGEPRNNLAVVLLLTGRPAEAKEQLAIAEKNGFKVSAGLRGDIEAALTGGAKTPNP
jgi:tetratricopeptide (TPR) repeat protein